MQSVGAALDHADLVVQALDCGSVGPHSARSARCATRSPAETPAALASRRHNGGTEPAAPPGRGRFDNPRTAGPGHAVVGGRTRSNAPCHTCRRLFFCPPHQSNEARLRITEDSLYIRQRMETGKRVCVRQPAGLACLGHPAIMPNFPASSTHAVLGKTSLARPLCPNCYPLRFTNL
jgi:hypothetical protein